MLVYFIIILTALLGFCGLAIDTGRMELRENQLQAAADIGALAAAGELWHAGTGSNWQTAADNDIAAYETANGISSTAPSSLHLGATYGPYVGDASVVQVTVTQNFPTIFLGLLTRANSSITLTAKAVAEIPPCMVFFGTPTISSTYDYWVASAGVDPTSHACPLYSKNGVIIDYFARYGNNQIRSSVPATSSSVTGNTFTPVYSVPVISDPLSYIPARTVGQCLNSSPLSYLNQSTGTTISLAPGTYCGKTTATPTYTPGPIGCLGSTASTTTPALDVEGKYVTPVGGVGCPTQSATNGGNCTTNPTLSLSAGLYIFIGGINLNCITVTGTGVTIYLTNSQTVGYGQFRMTSTQWNVSAPNVGDPNVLTGPIAGVTVMTDRNWVASTTGATQDMQWMYSTWYGDGVIYTPSTGIYGYATGFSGPNYMNVVAANMYTYDKEVQPSVNYANLPTGNPLRTVISLVQ